MNETNNEEMKAWLQLDNDLQTSHVMMDSTDIEEMMLVYVNEETAALMMIMLQNPWQSR